MMDRKGPILHHLSKTWGIENQDLDLVGWEVNDDSSRSILDRRFLVQNRKKADKLDGGYMD